MVKKILALLLFLSLALVLVACGTTQQPTGKPTEKQDVAEKPKVAEDEVAQFFKGKTIDFIVPYSPGGGYDAVSRDLAPFLEKYTGATILVKNVTGGGGNIGFNALYNARPDGLTIGILNAGGAIQGQLLDSRDIVKLDGIEFDVTKYSYLGRINNEPKVVYVSGNNQDINSFADLINSPKPLAGGFVGPLDDSALAAVGIVAAFKLPSRVVYGYEGMANVELAVMSGEVDFSVGSAPARLSTIKAGDIKPLVLVGGAYSELPDVPQGIELATDEESKVILNALDLATMAGRAVAAPAGLPEEKRLFLEQALEKSITDPELVAKFNKAQRPIGWIKGSNYQKEVVDKIFAQTPQVLLDVWKKEIVQ